MTFSKIQIVGGVIALLFVILISLAATGNLTTGAHKYDDFALCLSEKGAMMYGTFWCPHCKEQKAMFKKSWNYVNYIECSTADGRGQTRACKQADLEGYPTWEFADGSRESRKMPLEELATRTGCELPV